jgi:hypothetical protein
MTAEAVPIVTIATSPASNINQRRPGAFRRRIPDVPCFIAFCMVVVGNQAKTARSGRCTVTGPSVTCVMDAVKTMRLRLPASIAAALQPGRLQA